MRSDQAIAALLQQQYNGENVFDYQNRIGVVSVALKNDPDCTNILFEGSKNIPDWYSNFQCNMIQTELGGVEEGFYQDMPETMDDIIPRLQTGKPIRIGGHSRGAAHGHIAARILVERGYAPTMLLRTVFGSPRPGNITFVQGLKGSPGVSYRNYIDTLQQDFVCDVPVHFNFLPYEIPEQYTFISEQPDPSDAWLFLRWHHLFLYQQGANDKEI